MININLVFDDEFDDVDIISVPNEIASKIEEIAHEFLCWIPTTNDKEYWITEDGRKVLVAETDGFIKWLNTFYCKSKEKAFVVERKTRYYPQYKTINF